MVVGKLECRGATNAEGKIERLHHSFIRLVSDGDSVAKAGAGGAD
jgi:hypothetical protein